MRKQRMSFEEAMEFVPDDLPDGAFFAMAHELAGIEYGECSYAPALEKRRQTEPVICEQCGKKFERRSYMLQHVAAKARNGTHKRIQF